MSHLPGFLAGQITSYRCPGPNVGRGTRRENEPNEKKIIDGLNKQERSPKSAFVWMLRLVLHGHLHALLVLHLHLVRIG